ncbi:MAG: DUF5036 family protein [Muribaculaceae bacterium]|nr:DUF5036 family protein [Muribaculaceae bacterium]
MKTNKHIHWLIMFVLALIPVSLCSCSDDDEDEGQSSWGYPDVEPPTDAMKLNMMNESHGKSLLGNTDVYLSDGKNFVSEGDYLIGVPENPRNDFHPYTLDLSQLFSEVSVTTKTVYRLFPKDNIHRFPSGYKALEHGTVYVNAYVASWIKKSKKIVGANVFFKEYVFNDLVPYTAKIYLNSSTRPHEKVENILRYGGDEIEIISVTPALGDFQVIKKSNQLITITTFGPISLEIIVYVRNVMVYGVQHVIITPGAPNDGSITD